ncbi:MAG: calcium-binding protein [Acidimicrobiales bacterium]
MTIDAQPSTTRSRVVRSKRPGIARSPMLWLVALAGLVGALVATAAPAGAAVNCDDTTSAVVVTVFDTTEDVTLAVSGDQLLLNGAVCGADVTSVAVVDINAAQNQTIIVDASSPWIINGSIVQLNLVLTSAAPGTDTIRVIGAANIDRAKLLAKNVVINKASNIPGATDSLGDPTSISLTMGWPGADADPNFQFRLGGGADTFDLVTDGGTFTKGVDVDGGGGNDIINGTALADTLAGGGGNDTINGMGGNDRLFGGANDDTIRGGTGNDFIKGDGGSDNVQGQDGNDRVLGNAGADTVLGGAGTDTTNGGKGDDTVKGGGGDDKVNGNAGADTVIGGPGADVANGGKGEDTVKGGGGNDVINGNTQDDTLIGGLGADSITGGLGADIVRGNGGNDTFDTADAFVDVVSGGKGIDTCAPCDTRDLVRADVENA